MLAYFLATIMAFKSITLLLNAFFSPKTHRQDDFLWSGLGLFYALILWLCAGRFTGAVLLGQAAGVAITIAFMWENQSLRKAITAESDSNQVLEGFSVLNFIGKSLTKVTNRQKTPLVKTAESVTPQSTPEAITAPESTTQITEETLAESQPTSETIEEVIIEQSTQPEIITENINQEETSSQPENISSPITESSSIMTDTIDESVIIEDDNQQSEETVDKIVVEKVAIVAEEITVTKIPEKSEATDTETENIEIQTKIEEKEESEEEDFFADSPSLVNESIDNQPQSKPNFFSRIVNIFRKPKTKTPSISTDETQIPKSKIETKEPPTTDETISETDSINDRIIVNDVEKFSTDNVEVVSKIDPSSDTVEVEETSEKLDLSDNSKDNLESTQLETVNIDETSTIETTTTEDIDKPIEVETQTLEEDDLTPEATFKETSLSTDTESIDAIEQQEVETQTVVETTTEESASPITTDEASIDLEKEEQNIDGAKEEDEVILSGIEISVEQDLEADSQTSNDDQTISSTNQEEVVVDGMEINVEQNLEADSQTSNDDEIISSIDREEKVNPEATEVIIQPDSGLNSDTIKEEQIPSVESFSQTPENVPEQDIIQSLNDLPSTVDETNPWLDDSSSSPATKTQTEDDDSDDDIESLAKLFEDNDNDRE